MGPIHRGLDDEKESWFFCEKFKHLPIGRKRPDWGNRPQCCFETSGPRVGDRSRPLTPPGPSATSLYFSAQPYSTFLLSATLLYFSTFPSSTLLYFSTQRNLTLLFYCLSITQLFYNAYTECLMLILNASLASRAILQGGPEKTLFCNFCIPEVILARKFQKKKESHQNLTPDNMGWS